MGELVLTTYDWVPEMPRGFVRDLRIRWALEEAGLVGVISEKPLGRYQFWKRQETHWALADVTVFLLKVNEQH